MNPILSDIAKLQKRASKRREEGVFVVEGIREFREIPADRLTISVFSETFAKSNESLVSETRAMKHVKTFVVKDDDFAKISDTKTPQGVLGVVRLFSYDETEIFSEKNGLYVLLENLQDPGNLGTILRAGEAAGVTAVIMDAGTCDIYNPKVIRSTMGSLFRMKFFVTENLGETIRKMQSLGGTVYAAHLKGSVPYDTPDYTGMTGFLIGNEAKGLTDEITSVCEKAVRIPMKGKVESLNAAMAATVLMFEAARQRH